MFNLNTKWSLSNLNINHTMSNLNIKGSLSNLHPKCNLSNLNTKGSLSNLHPKCNLSNLNTKCTVFQLGPFHRADRPPFFKWCPVPFSWRYALFQSLYAIFKKNVSFILMFRNDPPFFSITLPCKYCARIIINILPVYLDN
jgi:hypothetical protein